MKDPDPWRAPFRICVLLLLLALVVDKHLPRLLARAQDAAADMRNAAKPEETTTVTGEPSSIERLYQPAK